MSHEPRPTFESVPSPREIEWRRILDRWRQSGLDGRAFCRREKLSDNLFYHWKREIRRREERRNGKELATPRRGVSAAPRRRPPKFVPIGITPAASPFELHLSGGRLLRIPGDFDGASLARLLEILEQTAC